MAGLIALAGKWRVEGNQLIATYKNQEVKATIVKITGDELKLNFAGKDTVYTWTRVKRSSRAQQVLCFTALFIRNVDTYPQTGEFKEPSRGEASRLMRCSSEPF